MWPNKSIDFVKLPNDEEGLHLGLFVENRMVSVISAFITDHAAQFRKFATLQEEQGNGYGTKLLRYLFNELSQRNVARIWCNARVEKASFYERFGLSKTSQYFSRSGLDYVIMEMIVKQ